MPMWGRIVHFPFRKLIEKRDQTEVFMSPCNNSARVPYWIALLIILGFGVSLTVNNTFAISPPADKKDHHNHDEVYVQVVFGERDRKN